MPLKSREVGLIDTDALLRLIRRKEDRIRLKESLVYVNDVAPYVDAIANYIQRRRDDPSIPNPPPADRTSNMSREDVDQLLRHDIIQPIEISEIKANGIRYPTYPSAAGTRTGRAERASRPPSAPRVDWSTVSSCSEYFLPSRESRSDKLSADGM